MMCYKVFFHSAWGQSYRTSLIISEIHYLQIDKGERDYEQIL